MTEAESGIAFEQIEKWAQYNEKLLRIFKAVTNKLIEGGVPQESIRHLKTFEHLVEFLEIPSETPDNRLAWALHQAADLMLAERHANTALPVTAPSAGHHLETVGKGTKPNSKPKKRGRKPATEASKAEDKRIWDANETRHYPSYEELGREFSKSGDEVRRAIDRHRKRLEVARNKSSE